MKKPLLLITCLFIFFFTSNLIGQTDIVCIGNSISQGSVNRGTFTGTVIGDSLAEMSYRFLLWEKLDSAGVNIDFVGSYNRYFDQDASTTYTQTSRYTGHSFPPNHECYYGITAGGWLTGGWSNKGFTLSDVDTRLANDYTADVAIIHIGHNGDVSTVPQKVINIRSIINKLKGDNPYVSVLLSSLITGQFADLQALNDSIYSLADELTRDSSVVYLVDNTTGFITNPGTSGTMTHDWVHPNGIGTQFMADRFYAAYMKIMSADAENPTQPGNFSVSNVTSSSADLSWDASTDNMGVNVYKLLLNGVEIAQTPNTSISISEVDFSGEYTLSVVAIDYQRNESSAATYTSEPTYTLTVTNGTGTGSYTEGTVVSVVAIGAVLCEEFDTWTGDVPSGDMTQTSISVTIGTSDISITGTYKDIDPVDLSSLPGTLSAPSCPQGYLPGDVITITADAPASACQEFDAWTGDISALADANSANTTLTVPASTISLSAIYADVGTAVSLTVNSGTAEASDCPHGYTEGETIVVTADTPPVSQVFDTWTGDISGLADANSATTTLTMPATAVSITATYKTPTNPTYTVTVNGGLGSGTYEEGASVTIIADAPGANEEFGGWTGSTSYLNDVTAATATFTMPNEDVTFTSVYNDITGISDNYADINIYPNPASSFVTITNLHDVSYIKLMNSTGQIFRTFEVNSENIRMDVNGLSSGIYILRIEGSVIKNKVLLIK